MTPSLLHAIGVAFLVPVAVLIAGAASPSRPSPPNLSGVVAVHDPSDIPFRRAPMGLSSRSIVVSLATNLHLAFDAHLLRTHTVWEGSPLNLFGPPFSGTATRFLCDMSGTPLWGSLPTQPWELAGTLGGDFASGNARFLGVSTLGGSTTFRYELHSSDGAPVRVEETPRRERILSRDIVVRRVAVTSLAAPARFFPFHGAGEIFPLPGAGGSLAIQRGKDLLLVAVRGLATNALIARRDEAAYVERVESERDGKGPYSVVVTNIVSGPQVQVVLTLPQSPSGHVFEVGMVVCADPAEAVALSHAFVSPQVKPTDPLSQTNTERDSFAQRPITVHPDPSFADRISGDESYRVEHFPVPRDIKLMVGGMDFLPNGDLAVCTYSGEVWIVEGAQGPPAKARWRRFARGLNEPGGLQVLNGQVVIAQKCELTRLIDTDANGEADLFECLSDAWGYTGNYHSFATGPALDALGNLYVAVTGHRTLYDVPYMGWCLRVSPQRSRATFSIQGSPAAEFSHSAIYQAEPFCSGLRVPNGLGTHAGDIFMTDNQGHWIAANKLNHLQSGKFYGHPSSRPAPRAQFDGDSNFAPPAVWFPYAWVHSASGIASITEDRFGPFRGQMLVGEFQNASVFRVALEKVNGEWQGAVFPFVKGFASGVNRLAFGPDGKLYVGGLRMGHWTSIAPQPHSLDRVSFTGKTPFEIREVHARADGFELVFTQPVDVASAGLAENWDSLQYTYAYDGKHNAPEKDRDEKIPGPPMRVTQAVVAADGFSVHLRTEGHQPRHVIRVRALDVKNAEGKKLRNDTFHYTMNAVPEI